MECIPFSFAKIIKCRFLLAQLKLNNVLGDCEGLESEIRKSLSSQSSSTNKVNEFYEKIIDQISRLDKRNRIRAFRALSWVLLAVRPLSIEELQEAVLIEPGTTEIDPAVLSDITGDIIIRWCRSLLICEQSSDRFRPSNIVRFNHMTVKEFLESHSPKFNEYRLSCNDLARTCLTYLGFKEFEIPCQEDESLSIRMNKYKLVEYASESGVVHLENEVQNDDQIRCLVVRVFGVQSRRQAIHQFMEQPVLHMMAHHGFAKICAILLNCEIEKRYMYFEAFINTKRTENSRTSKYKGKRSCGENCLTRCESKWSLRGREIATRSRR
jgi:hypothetical protein